MKYRIQYQHTSAKTANSMKNALHIVRCEFRKNRIFHVKTPDGVYCYRSRADMKKDDTGAHADAVITKNEP
jgi:hypothetical protein